MDDAHIWRHLDALIEQADPVLDGALSVAQPPQKDDDEGHEHRQQHAAIQETLAVAVQVQVHATAKGRNAVVLLHTFMDGWMCLVGDGRVGKWLVDKKMDACMDENGRWIE